MGLGRALTTLGTIAVVVSFTVLAYLANRLTERGMNADATGTAGYTTSTEIAVGIAAVAGLVFGLVAVIVGIVRLVALGRHQAGATELSPHV